MLEHEQSQVGISAVLSKYEEFISTLIDKHCKATTGVFSARWRETDNLSKTLQVTHFSDQKGRLECFFDEETDLPDTTIYLKNGCIEAVRTTKVSPDILQSLGRQFQRAIFYCAVLIGKNDLAIELILNRKRREEISTKLSIETGLFPERAILKADLDGNGNMVSESGKVCWDCNTAQLLGAILNESLG